MSLRDWTDLLIKAVNIYIIVWIFRKNFIERRAERLRDGDREARKFMVQEVVLKKNMDLIAGFIFDVNERMKNLPARFRDAELYERALNEQRDAIAEFKKELDVINLRIIKPLKHLSPAFASLNTCLENIEDVFTEYVGELTKDGGSTNPREALLRMEEAYSGFITALLDGQRQFLCGQEPDISQKSLLHKFKLCFTKR